VGIIEFGSGAPYRKVAIRRSGTLNNGSLEFPNTLWIMVLDSGGSPRTITG